MPFVDAGPRRIEYAVVKGASRRYTYFRFRPDMTLEVILPRGRKVDVHEELKARLEWIERESERLARSRSVLGPDEVMFGGVMLKVFFSQSSNEGLVPDLANRELMIRATERRRIRELVLRWFLKETSAYVVRKVSEFAPTLGMRPSRVDVREIGKWGYCTRGGRLSFSWQLAALPERLRKYVVLHELIHLSEFNHSPAFHRKLRAVCPDFREREKELDSIVPYDRLAPAA